jgi:glycosyltransferase involved in cell wall biosynthesis
VARNDPIKDNATLFSAFRRLAGARPRAHLLAIGAGMDAGNEEVMALVRTTGAAGRVHLLGRQLEVEELVAAFDVAVSSSRTAEGFQTVLAEAMACAVPAVATDVGEARTIIADPARIVPRADPDALAAAVAAVLDLPAQQRARMGAQDRARIEANFAIAAAAEKFEAVWTAVADEAQARTRSRG